MRLWPERRPTRITVWSRNPGADAASRSFLVSEKVEDPRLTDRVCAEGPIALPGGTHTRRREIRATRARDLIRCRVIEL
jgi:hypothetical protein